MLDIANTDWNDDASDGTLEERLYYCQNWRHDVVALVTSGGALRERVRYTAYGIPVGMPHSYGWRDCDGDGDVDAADQSILLGAWGTNTAKCDLNLDGTVDAADNAILLGQLGATAGFGRLSLSGNRFGYAGYASDPAVHADWHVRHRVLMSELGRWSRRDPIGYLDGSSLYAYSTSRVLRRTDPSGLASAPPDPCKQCNRDLKNDFGGVGVVKHLKQVIEDNCPHCHPLSVTCRNPATEPNCTGISWDDAGNPIRTRLKGYATKPPPGGCPTIGLCGDLANRRTYLHELMHAWDLCSANHMPQGLDTCKECAWMEARAFAMMGNDCEVDGGHIRRGCASCKATGRCKTEAICMDQWTQEDLNKSFELHPIPCTANYPQRRKEQRDDFQWVPDVWQCGSQP